MTNRPLCVAPVRTWITAERLALYCLPTLALYITVVVLWMKASHGFTATDVSHPGSDLEVFWTASYVFLHDHAWRVYDYNAFSGYEHRLFAFDIHEFLPWLYPPTFLVAIAPLALIPFPLAYGLWLLGGLSLYTWGVRRVADLDEPLGAARATFVLAACPFAVVAMMFGQNSLFTAGLAALGLYWLERRPIAAGVCIGLLAIKPQLALLFPLALLFGSAWRAMAAAAATALVFSVASVGLAGWKSAQMFLSATDLGGFILQHAASFWYASPTPFAVFRLAGLSLPATFALHCCIGLVAVAAMCKIWLKTRDMTMRAAVFAVATLLTNPYVWHYELAWLGIAAACLISLGLRTGWRRGEQALLVLTWLMPIYEVFNRVMLGPQVGPIVVLLFLLVLLRRSSGEMPIVRAAQRR